jgi:antitoxin ParD1/3/4
MVFYHVPVTKEHGDYTHPDQEAWYKTHVATGDFASVEEAARQLIDERIAEPATEVGDELT